MYAYFRLSGGVGIPFFHWYGTEHERSVVVLDLLGPSLERTFNRCNRKFSLKTVLLLADQITSHLEYIHSKSLIHRDIKPENILIGTGVRSCQINIVDFGLAKTYREPLTGRHIPYSDRKKLTGTARYASIHSHLGIEQSRRDDMESLGYLLVYLCKGSLPWQGIQANSKKQKQDPILQKKLLTPTKDLCYGLPEEFATFVNYVRSLGFVEKPDYKYLRGLLYGLFDQKGFKRDNVFDWDTRT